MSYNGRKLHIGAGRVHLPGFINVDLFDTYQQDLYCDVTRLPFEPCCFDLIYASHVLEHVHRRMINATLHHWVRLLVPGGVLRLAVPDFAAIAKRYRETSDLNELMGLLYGGQDHPRNYHGVAFDKETLSHAMRLSGLENVREWDWRKTEHAAFDDYSRAYLPHRDLSGQLMSLNLEGTK